MNTYLKFSALAFQMAIVIGVLTYAGYKLDDTYGKSNPVFTIIGSLVGIGISFYLLFKEIKSLK